MGTDTVSQPNPSYKVEGIKWRRYATLSTLEKKQDENVLDNRRLQDVSLYGT